jgi:RHS repeat-associated protein
MRLDGHYSKNIFLGTSTAVLVSSLLVVLNHYLPRHDNQPRPLVLPAIVPTDATNGIASAPAAGSFAVSSDGAATFSYPIWTPQGRRAVEPSLTLAYNSRRGNGSIGVGWSLQGLSVIMRCKRDIARDGYNTAITFTQSDAFCLDGQRMVAYPNASVPNITGLYGDPNTEYRTEIDQYARIISGPTDSLGPLWFKVERKDGLIFYYGTTPDSRLEGARFHSVVSDLSSIAKQTDFNQKVRLSWSLAKVVDRFGNNLTVQYSISGDPTQGSGLEQIPQTISYTGTEDGSLTQQRLVTFVYAPRNDTVTSYVGGLRLQSRHVLKQISLTAPNPVTPSVVKTYNITYQQSNSTERSLLTSISECDAAGVCLKPTTFSYSAQVPDGFTDVNTGIHDDTAIGVAGPSIGPRIGQVLAGDWNGDGCDDFIFTAVDSQGEFLHAGYRLSSCYDNILDSQPAFPAPMPTASFQLSPPLSGISSSHLPADVFRKTTNCSDPNNCYFNQVLTMDLDLDGRSDLIRYSVNESGTRQAEQGKQDYLTQVSLASGVPPSQWNPSKGLFNATSGNLVVTAAPTQFLVPGATKYFYTSIYVGDINGDGYPDLVHLLPGGWSFQLNLGREVHPQPLITSCVSPDTACLGLGPESPFFPAGIAHKGGMKNVFMIDIDNDGTTDLLLRDPSGRNWYEAFSLSAQGVPRDPVNIALLAGEVNDSRDWFADLNGDGLPDSVSVPTSGGAPVIALNTGNGFEDTKGAFGAPLPGQTGPAVVAAVPGGTDVAIFDYDGDNNQDFIVAGTSGLISLVSRDGNQFESVPLVDDKNRSIPVGTNLAVLDANGDGLSDFAQIVNGDLHVYIRRGQRRDLLTGVNDRDAQITINHAPITSAAVYKTTVAPGVISTLGLGTSAKPTYVVNRGPWVVRSYTVPRAGSFNNQVNSYTFSYADARRDLLGHGWLGFATVSSIDMQTNGQVSTIYDNSTMMGAAYPYAWRPTIQRSAVLLSAAKLGYERQTQTTYDVQGTSDGRYLSVLPKEVRTQDFQIAGIFGIRQLRNIDTVFQHDGFGNTTNIITKTADGWIDNQTVKYQYNIPEWIVAMPQLFTDTNTAPSGETKTRTTSFYFDTNTGTMLTKTIEPTGTESDYSQLQETPDVHGVSKTLTVVDLNRTQRRIFTATLDTLEDLYPTTITNPLGFVEQFTFHPGLGVLARHLDANNVERRWQYDGFGRLKRVLPADDNVVNLTYSGGGGFEIDVKTGDGQKATVLYDPYLHEIERDHTGFDGETIISLISYNGQDLVAEVDGPCFNGPQPCSQTGQKQFGYDELGRLLSLRKADGSVRSWSYDGLKTTYQNASGNQRYNVRDELGHAIKSVSFNASGQEIVTTFAYEPFGLLQKIIDTTGSETRQVHDVRGRTIVLNDHDSGDHFFTWTPYDELLSEQNGNSVTKTYQYDGLGRVFKSTEPAGTSTITWDTAPNGIGKPASATSTDGVTTTYSYDSQSRLTSTTCNIEQTPYKIQLTYDLLGRIDTITYPTVPGRPPFAIRRHYNQNGFLDQVLDLNNNKVYWEIETEDARGQILNELAGNGVKTQRSFYREGALKDTTTTGPQLLESSAYTYYPSSSVHTRTNRSLPLQLTETFTYDPLDRLADWSATSEDLGTRIHVVKPLLHQTFTYDDIGNLKSRNSLLGGGLNLTYQYGQNGAGPHAVTEVNTDSYGYDHAGNQKSGPGRTINYNSSNLPVTINQGSSTATLSYGPGHERVLKRYSPQDSVIYVGGLYERRTQASQTTHVFYIPGAGRFPVAQVQWTDSQSGDKTLYLHGDNLSSVRFATDSTGSEAEEFWYEPFGSSEALASLGTGVTHPSSSISEGFTAQSQDLELNLINMKGRIYDPKIGRFLTADPLIQSSMRSESLNRYTYAWNNPLKWTDPTGFQDDSSGGTDDDSTGQNLGGGGDDGGPVAILTGSYSPNSETDPSLEPSMVTASDNGIYQSVSDNGASGKPGTTNDFATWKSKQDRYNGLTPEARQGWESVDLSDKIEGVTDRAVFWMSATLRWASFLAGPEVAAVVDMGLDKADSNMNWDSTGGEGLRALHFAVGMGMSLSSITEVPISGPTAADRMVANADNGKIFEKVVLNELGLEKNTESITKAIGKGNPLTKIPDALGAERGVFEIKDWKYVPFNPQLKVEMLSAIDNNMPMYLIVSPQTRVSMPAILHINATGGGVFVFDPFTRTFSPYIIR